ncbi:MAG: hypothetical protein AMJ75_01945 [Phycisphaerae bacterium SM1_79]|nr:MAG: hypothetical protein AMJ75_01945 [Phycisphaerae bacterium SM1_79]
MIGIDGFDDKVEYGTRHAPSCLLVVLVLMMALLGEQPCSGQGDPDLMRFIADGYEANLEKLRTWRGTAVRQGSRTTGQSADSSVPSKSEEEWTEQLKFVNDRDRNTTLWYGKTIGGRYLENGEYKPPLLNLNSGMNKGEYHYKMDFREEAEFSQSPRTLRAYSRDAVGHGLQTSEFDPVWVLVEDVGLYGDMGEHLRGWAKSIEEEPMPERGYKLVRQGDLVTLDLFAPEDDSEDSGTVTSRYVFDLAKGCSVVEQHHTSSVSETHWKLDYEEHRGVFVPKEIARVFANKQKGRESKTRHHVAFTTEMVNEPVSESEFEYQALGLRPGDYIVDHVKGGLRYQWHPDFGIDKAFETPSADVGPLDTKGSLQPAKNETETPKKQEAQAVPVPAEEVVATGQPQQKNRIVIAYWLGLLGILAIIVVGVLFLRRKVRTTKEAK